MAKFFTLCALFLSLGTLVNGQQPAGIKANPFASLLFSKGYKDTVTLVANYTGVTGSIGDSNLVTLQQLSRTYSEDLKRYQNAIAFTVTGYPQKFYAPYKDNYRPLIAQAKADGKLRVRCVVYRFFTIDGYCNFFYIDNISI